MPLGGLARVGGPSALGVAAFTFEDDETQPGSFKITACGYGPGGPSLATHLAAQARVWEELGRPGAAGLELSAWLPGTSLETIGGATMVPGPAACAPRTALTGVVTVCLRGQI